MYRTPNSSTNSWYFPNYPRSRPFTGEIISARPVGSSAANTVIHYEARFPPQLGDPEVDNIEMTETEMFQAHQDYMEYMKRSKGTDFYLIDKII